MSLRDNDGYTPLHLAAREGHVNAFRDMLRKGKHLNRLGNIMSMTQAIRKNISEFFQQDSNL